MKDDSFGCKVKYFYNVFKYALPNYDKIHKYNNCSVHNMNLIAKIKNIDKILIMQSINLILTINKLNSYNLTFHREYLGKVFIWNKVYHNGYLNYL